MYIHSKTKNADKITEQYELEEMRAFYEDIGLSEEQIKKALEDYKKKNYPIRNPHLYNQGECQN